MGEAAKTLPDQMLFTLTAGQLEATVRGAVAQGVKEALAGRPDKQWATVAEVADLYVVTTQTIRNHIAAGAPARRIGVKEYRINLEAFGKWLDERSEREDKPAKRPKVVR